MKFFLKTALASTMAMALVSAPAQASDVCQDGEIVIKFSHVTNTDKHLKGIAATVKWMARCVWKYIQTQPHTAMEKC